MAETVIGTGNSDFLFDLRQSVAQQGLPLCLTPHLVI